LLFGNLILTYLTKVIAKEAFRDYKTIDELLSLEPLGDEIIQLYLRNIIYEILAPDRTSTCMVRFRLRHINVCRSFSKA
jgi:hypothetical protein